MKNIDSPASSSDSNFKDEKINESVLLVEQAIISLEDDPFLNAGYGSNLTWDGTVECDAALHTSSSSNHCHFGSVGAVSGIMT